MHRALILSIDVNCRVRNSLTNPHIVIGVRSHNKVIQDTHKFRDLYPLLDKSIIDCLGTKFIDKPQPIYDNDITFGCPGRASNP